MTSLLVNLLSMPKLEDLDGWRARTFRTDTRVREGTLADGSVAPRVAIACFVCHVAEASDVIEIAALGPVPVCEGCALT